MKCRAASCAAMLLLLLPARGAPQQGPPRPQPTTADASRLGVPVIILFTGNTRASLEGPSPALGGLARRASVIGAARRERLPTLLVDAGGLFDGSDEFDRLRAAWYLRILSLLGYRALNLSPTELRFGWQWLAQTLGASPAEHAPPLISANAAVPERFNAIPIHTAGVAEVGPWRVALVGFAYPGDKSTVSARAQWLEVIQAASQAIPKLARQADAVVVLADLPRKLLRNLATVPGVDLVISADAGPDIERIEGVPIVHCRPQGLAIGRVDALVNARGLTVQKVVQVELTGAVPREPSVEQALVAFRAEAFTKLGGQRVRPPVNEQQPTAGSYVGAEVCGDCHKDASAQWRQTGHARAFSSLYAGQRQLVPRCQSCHTTGFGRQGGYDPRVGTPALRNVQCEACHGPGAAHALDPSTKNIRSTADAALCRQCHDKANSPQFERQLQGYMKEVDHKQILAALSPPAAAPKPERTPPPKPKAEKPVVELFVMSMCPYGMRTEQLLFPWVEKMKDSIDFRLRFIAREQDQAEKPTAGEEPETPPAEQPGGLRLDQEPGCVGEPEPSRGPFASLHGQAEVDEDVRQAVMIELFPDRYRSYILCRNRDIRSPDWQACALDNGIDADLVARVAASPEGAAIFRRNIARKRELGARVSPTIYINGRKYEGKVRLPDIAQGICNVQPDAELCTRKPVCVSDSDCDQPGKVGVCVDPGTPKASCRVSDPVPFLLIAINAPQEQCPACHPGPGLRSLLTLFPYANVQSLAYDDPAARPLIERYKIDAFPAYLFGPRVRGHPRFKRIEPHVIEIGDRLLLDPGLNSVTYFPQRKLRPGRLDVWVQPHAPASLRVMAAFIRHMARRRGSCRFRYLVRRRTGPPVRGAVQPWKAAERYASANGELELEAAVRQLCVQERYPREFFYYLLAYNGLVGSPRAHERALKSRHLLPRRVDDCARGPQGLELMDRNFQQQEALHIRYAPMALINNRLLMTAESIDLVKNAYDRLNPPVQDEHDGGKE